MDVIMIFSMCLINWYWGESWLGVIEVSFFWVVVLIGKGKVFVFNVLVVGFLCKGFLRSFMFWDNLKNWYK